MKKLLTVFLLIFICSTQVQSQALIALLFGKSISGPKLDMGLQLGLNSSYLLNSEASRPLTSFSFGAFTNYKFHKKWNFNTFFNFKSNRGAQKLDTAYGYYDFTNDSLEEVVLTRRFSYIDIVPEIQYKISPSFSIGVGPVISILVRARDFYEAEEKDALVTYEQNIYKQATAMDVGAVIDFQYGFRKGQGPYLNFKYMQGFISPYKANSGASILNATFNIGVGIPMRGKEPEKPDEEK